MDNMDGKHKKLVSLVVYMKKNSIANCAFICIKQ